MLMRIKHIGEIMRAVYINADTTTYREMCQNQLGISCTKRMIRMPETISDKRIPALGIGIVRVRTTGRA